MSDMSYAIMLHQPAAFCSGHNIFWGDMLSCSSQTVFFRHKNTVQDTKNHFRLFGG
jgi:hypothetical protein